MNSPFSVKKLTFFRGHDGAGLNADIYHGKNKIAEVDDDGWGGGLAMRFVGTNRNRVPDSTVKVIDELLESLPEITFSDVGTSDSQSVYTWDMEHLFNELIELESSRKDALKILRKASAINKDNNVVSWKYKASLLDKPVINNKKVSTFRDSFAEVCEKEGMIFLNNLPKDEAVKLIMETL